MHKLSVRYQTNHEPHLLATFPSYVTARQSVFDTVAQCGGHIIAVATNEHNGNVEFMATDAERRVVEYVIHTDANDN